ncbi:MAG: sugar ABC transporter substrate-binding protein [Chloroflexi bacterium]|nr:sugar ABC transporter substrate-binding protein [Chloroflexota bacterium]
MTRHASRTIQSIVTRRGFLRTGAAVATGAGALALAACGSAGGETSVKAGERPAMLTFLDYTTGAELQLHQEHVAAFQQQHPKIQVEHTPISGGNSAYIEKVLASSAAGTPVDTLRLNQRIFTTFLSNKLLAPLDPLITAEKYDTKAYYPHVWTIYAKDGKRWGLPYNFGTFHVYWNKTLFTAAGVKPPDDSWDWQRFLDAAKALTKDTNGDGIPDQYGFGWSSNDSNWATFVWGNGGDFLNKEMTQCTLTAAPAQEAIEFYADLAAKHRVAPPSGADGRNFGFTRGNVAMQIADPRMGTGQLKEAVFQWEVAPPPKRKKREVLFTGFAWAVHAQSRFAPEAFRLATFLSRPEFQKDLADRGLALPSLQKLAEQYPISKSFATTLPVSRSLPLHPELDEMRKEMSNIMTKAGAGQVAGRQAAQQMCDAITPLLGRK